MEEAVERINHAADILLNQGDREEDAAAVVAEAAPEIKEEDAYMGPKETIASAKIVNVVIVHEEAKEGPQNPSQGATTSSRSKYARRMVPPETVSTSTYLLGDRKKVKTTIFRRRSNSLE